ncbi:MAG: hypothetical protein IPI10_19345 [Bacteroidetes bacterium]|nr:hypothetical protein [Bacteroidota bacterium]
MVPFRILPGTGNYAIAHGTTLLSGRMNYNLNVKTYFIYISKLQTASGIFFSTVFSLKGLPTRSDRYGLRYGLQSPNAFVYLKPTYIYEENISLRSYKRSWCRI